MTQTIDADTLPPIAEAMTARDLNAWADSLAQTLGSNWTVRLSPNLGHAGPAYWAVDRTDPVTFRNVQHEYGFVASWPEAVAAVQALIANRPKVERNAVIRKLALAIIELTDENGKCTVAHLRAKGFDEDEIALHAEDCERAGEMAGNAPFSVEGV